MSHLVGKDQREIFRHVLTWNFSVCSTLAGGPPQQVIVQAQVPPPPHGIPHLGHPHLISTNPPPASSPQPLMTTVQPELVPTSLPVWGSSAPGAMPTQQIIQQVQLSLFLYFVCILYLALACIRVIRCSISCLLHYYSL